MRKIWIVALLLLAPLTAFVQTASAQTWDTLQQLQPGDEIKVNARFSLFARSPGTRTCIFTAVSDQDLDCIQTHHLLFFPYTLRFHYDRDRVRKVRRARPGLSALSGAAIGAGIFAGFGLAADSRNNEDNHLGTLVLTIFGAALGGYIGAESDFLAGPTLYRAP